MKKQILIGMIGGAIASVIIIGMAYFLGLIFKP